MPAAGSPAFPARVVGVRTVVPRVVAVTFGGPALADLPPPSPGGHVRLFFGEQEPDGPEARYLRRTMTPRRFDAARAELEVEFVLHGSGLAADWARSAAPGDPVVVSGAGGRYRPEPVAGRFVAAVDDTGIPAAGTIAEALPAATDLLVLAEVTDADDERPITDQRPVGVRWLHRSSVGAGPGELLEAAVRDLSEGTEAGWFVAAEARTVRRLHRHLVEERGVPDEHVEPRGYWRRRDVAGS